jgi:hypothetical protein
MMISWKKNLRLKISQYHIIHYKGFEGTAVAEPRKIHGPTFSLSQNTMSSMGGFGILAP